MHSLKSGGRFGARQIIPMALLLALLIIACILPQIQSMRYTIVLLSTIIMYIVTSVSYTIFSGPTGYVSLATAAFYGIGFYATAIFAGKLPIAVLMLVGGVASLVVAVIIGAVTLRLRGVYFTIFSFALVKLLDSLINWLEIRISGTRGHHLPLIKEMGFTDKFKLNETVYYYLLGALVLTLVVAFILKRSRFGMSLTAIGECEDAASHIGINTTIYKITAFGISAFWVGVVGAAMALKAGYIDSGTAFNPLMSFIPILMAIFGGMSSLPGPVLGAAVFAYITEILSTRFPNYAMLLTGAVMVIAILFLPSGIIGLVQKTIGNIKLRRAGGSANT